MENPDYKSQYRAMTDEDLMNLAAVSDQVKPEARNFLAGELSRRVLQLASHDRE
jgi:hypothetical protein